MILSEYRNSTSQEPGLLTNLNSQTCSQTQRRKFIVHVVWPLATLFLILQNPLTQVGNLGHAKPSSHNMKHGSEWAQIPTTQSQAAQTVDDSTVSEAVLSSVAVRVTTHNSPTSAHGGEQPR